jgi:hypothetical protein
MTIYFNIEKSVNDHSLMREMTFEGKPAIISFFINISMLMISNAALEF